MGASSTSVSKIHQKNFGHLEHGLKILMYKVYSMPYNEMIIMFDKKMISEQIMK